MRTSRDRYLNIYAEKPEATSSGTRLLRDAIELMEQISARDARMMNIPDYQHSWYEEFSEGSRALHIQLEAVRVLGQRFKEKLGELGNALADLTERQRAGLDELKADYRDVQQRVSGYERQLARFKAAMLSAPRYDEPVEA